MHRSRINLGSIIRIIFVVLAVVGTFVLVYMLSQRITTGSVIYYAIQLAGVISLLVMLNRSDSPSMKIGWLLIVFILPFFGLILYMIWGRFHLNRREMGYYQKAFQAGYRNLPQDEAVLEDIRREHPRALRNAQYLRTAGYPVYRNGEVEYISIGEDMFERMIQDIRAAQRYIFIEFFIVEAGALWERVFDVLAQKAMEGVEVRLFYDDMGSIFTVPDGFKLMMVRAGIQVEVFSPIHRYISRFNWNYRDHQKIVVIDGEIGYTGGVNLSDEYANLYAKHGHWKDTAVRLRGDAVWNLTVIFMQMWDFVRKTHTENYDWYRARTSMEPTSGYVQVFADGPTNRELTPAKGIYQMMAEQANDYIYITTPYFVIDDFLVDSLCRAAQGGVDVRIVCPCIPDHWYTHIVTRSFYGQLMRAGVRVYEYTPGFIHAKMIVVDDLFAVVGSINWDNRSFYLQYENAAVFYGCDVLHDIKADILATLERCKEQTLPEWNRRHLATKALAAVLRLFAPLM